MQTLSSHVISFDLSFSLRVSETKIKSKTSWTMMMKVIWKMRKHSSWFVWFFVTFLKGILSFAISHHRCMLHCHCFVVVVLILWHHIFHLIHLQYKFPCKSREDYNFLEISLKSVHSLTPTCLWSKGKLHEIYHLETASYGFFLGHLFVSMKRQWLIKLKYVCVEFFIN